MYSAITLAFGVRLFVLCKILSAAPTPFICSFLVLSIAGRSGGGRSAQTLAFGARGCALRARSSVWFPC